MERVEKHRDQFIKVPLQVQVDHLIIALLHPLQVYHEIEAKTREYRKQTTATENIY